MDREMLEMAERVRRICLDVAGRAYEEAGVRGLCPEGRWDVAMDAVRALDLRVELGRVIGKNDP